MHTAHTHIYAKEVTGDFIKEETWLGIQLTGRAFAWSGLHLQHGVRGEKERARNTGTLKRGCGDTGMCLQTKTWEKPLLQLDHPYWHRDLKV